MSAAKGSAQYSREEMDAILQRALHRQSAKRDGVSHDELVAAAEEIGVPREEIEAAARDLAAEKERQALEKEKLAPLEDRRAQMKLRLYRGYALWLAMGAMFFAISHQTHTHGFVIPLAAVGIMLLIRTVNVFFAPATQLRESKRDRRERRREEKLREFERKVAIGTDAVVRVVEATRGKSRDVASPSSASAPNPAAVAPLVTAFDAFAKRGGTASPKHESSSARARHRIESSSARARIDGGDEIRDDERSDEIADDFDARLRNAKR